MKRIYLDYAATTPMDKSVNKLMREFDVEFYGNPSSQHREGMQARAKIDFARASVAKFLNSRPQDIVFTSGATEANNLVIQGTVSSYIKKYQIKPHVITTKLEHQSVYNTVLELKNRGVIDATFIQPTPDGLINPNDIIKEITHQTVLVSVIFVSNEIGSILPVREIGRALAEVNARAKMKVMYHIDAVQAANFLNLNVEKLDCDLLTLSAHKIYGPKGIGALYVRQGVKIENLSFGGSQEYGLRPGTQNSAGIIGMAAAVELLDSLEVRLAHAGNISKLRDEIILSLSELPGAILNGPTGESRIANNVSFTFLGVDQDALMTALDLAGVAASTGSACVSGSSEPSHVIDALGRVSNRQAATVRLSLGIKTKKTEVQFAVKAIKDIVQKLRS